MMKVTSKPGEGPRDMGDGRWVETVNCWQYDPFKECATIEQVQTMSSMANNPLADKTCMIFSEREDGRLTFEEFVDLYSTFHFRASRVEKVKCMFKIFSGGDGFINPCDIKMLVFSVINKG